MNNLNVKKPHLFVKITIQVCLLVLLMVALVRVLPTEAKSQWRRPNFESGEIIVSLQPWASIHFFNWLYGTKTKGKIAGTNQYLLDLATGVGVQGKLAQINGDPQVIFAGPNFTYEHAEVRQRSQAFVDQRSQAFLDGDSPVNFYGQPAVLRLHLTEAQRISRGVGVRVAVIDTGIDLNHPIFAGRISYPNYDFVDNDAYPQEVMGGAGAGHGTFVAGLIALTAPGAVIMPLRAFDSDGSGTSFDIAKAIRYAVDNGAQVINMSFGLKERDSLVLNAIGYASSRVYMVASAGNDDANSLHFPAERKNSTVAVTSTDAHDIKAPFANYNRDTKVSAPGVNLYSAYPGGLWATWSGTSFSTALVTGEAALVLSLKPTLDRTAMNTVIISSGVNIDTLNPAYTGLLGSVRIDFLDAVNRALGITQSRLIK
jgi:subtilisin family serine protease